MGLPSMGGAPRGAMGMGGTCFSKEQITVGKKALWNFRWFHKGTKGPASLTFREKSHEEKGSGSDRGGKEMDCGWKSYCSNSNAKER